MAERDKLLAGMVVEVGYLWKEEADQGHDRALKRRPCLIVEAVAEPDGVRVGIVPLTHNPPTNRFTQEIPASYLKQAGLDGQGCSVVLNEMNRFKWPNGDPDFKLVVRGTLPSGYFGQLRDVVSAQSYGQRISIVDRDEIQRAIVEAYREQDMEHEP